MITRLRKIFYDQWGWSTEVIRGAAKIQGRYEVKMVKQKAPSNHGGSEYIGLVPVVQYKKDDKEHPELAGKTPEIYSNDNQEVILPNGLFCDIGHILTGIDACNYFAPVTPVPKYFMFMYKLLPYVKSNMDFATWLGDLASTAGNYLFYEIKNNKSSESAEQKAIDDYSPGSDMLGNIDAYIIAALYNLKTNLGARVSQILYDYYYDIGVAAHYRKRRCFYFCEIMGLKGWDGKTFNNEVDWISYQKKQLRIATAFYVFGDLKNFTGFKLALKIWLKRYDNQLDLEHLLTMFLDTLKIDIREDQNNY